MRTTDGGKTWARVIERVKDGPELGTVLFANDKLGYAITHIVGAILHTKDGGASWANTNTGFEAYTRAASIERPIIDYARNPVDPSRVDIPVFGNPVVVQGFRLLDARASYGVGLQTFALGFPLHFDWSWRTLFNKEWEDVQFAQAGGSAAFRKPRFQVWIGYDF